MIPTEIVHRGFACRRTRVNLNREVITVKARARSLGRGVSFLTNFHFIQLDSSLLRALFSQSQVTEPLCFAVHIFSELPELRTPSLLC